MKNLFVLILTFTGMMLWDIPTIAKDDNTFASSLDRRDHHRHHHDGYYRGRHRGDGVLFFTCAPEVVHGNLRATDRILAEVATLPAFQGTTKFNAKVQEISALEPAAKVDAYFKLLNINPKNKAEVVRFVSGEEVDSRTLQNLTTELDLSYDQAIFVTKKIQKGLLGSVSR